MVARELVEAGCDTAVVFDLVEAALDEIALPVDFWIDDAPDPDIALARDMSGGAAGLDQLSDGAGEEAAIGDDGARQGQPVNQCGKDRLVGGLAGREQEANRQTMGVDHGVDLGAQSSTRTADDVIRAPFLPPPACWWARTIEVSIKRGEPGDCCARVSNILSHTPFLAQRLKRLYAVVYGPYRSGRSRHGEPVRRMKKMPLRMRRSSWRGTPRGLFGESGAMIDFSLSVRSNQAIGRASVVWKLGSQPDLKRNPL